jgi:hypothetical protein
VKLNARLRGMDGLRRGLGRVVDENGVRDELATAAEELRDAARAELGDAGSDTTLSHSLTVARTHDGTAATVSTPLDDAWHREFGTFRRLPRPWLAPALDKARPGIVARFRNWLTGAVKRSSS